MILLPFVALIIGAAIALSLNITPAHGASGQYLAVACLAGVDTIFGGVRSGLEGKFRNDIFITGFVSNVLICSFVAWFGDKIYINLFLAVALVLGSRILTNLSLIRRYVLTQWQDARDRKRLQSAAQATAVQAETNA